MNWLLLVVLVVLVGTIFDGYRKGFLKIAYSLVAWILIFAFVTWSVPYVSAYITNETTIPQKIQERCEESLRKRGSSQIEQQIDEQLGQQIGQQDGQQIEQQMTQETEQQIGNEPGILAGGQEELEKLGIGLPESVMESVMEKMADTANTMIEESGLYRVIAESMTEFIIQGMSFFLTFIIGLILSSIISGLLGIVSKIPVIKGTNRVAGLFVGAINGLVIVWIGFYLIAIFSSTEGGRVLLTYIYESQLLTTLYENNLLMTIIAFFL